MGYIGSIGGVPMEGLALVPNKILFANLAHLSTTALTTALWRLHSMALISPSELSKNFA